MRAELPAVYAQLAAFSPALLVVQVHGDIDVVPRVDLDRLPDLVAICHHRHVVLPGLDLEGRAERHLVAIDVERCGA